MNGRYIYLDNAATSFFKPAKTVEGVCEYLRHPGNPDRGSHDASLSASRMVLETRIKLAEFFDARDFEKVIFTSGITESLNTVIFGLFRPGDHVITTIYEHNSVLRPLYLLEKQGIRLDICSSEAEIEACIRPETRAVIMNHASNVTGRVQDIERTGRLCAEKGIIFIVDTAQSAGVIPISMKEKHIDILCFSGHKALLAMQGIGGFIISTEKDLHIRPLKVGGSGIRSFDHAHPDIYPNALEAGTLNVPGIISLYHSLDFINETGIEKIRESELSLRNYCLERMAGLEKISLYGCEDRQTEASTAVIAFNIEGLDASYAADRLSADFGIAVRSGAHCAPLVHEQYGTSSMLRASFGLNNTIEDAEAFIEALSAIISCI